MKVKSVTKRVTKIDADGKSYTVLEEIPYDAANEEKQAEGLLYRDVVLFADGSYKESSSGIRHQPPNDKQFPKEVWKNILRYYSLKSDRLSRQFDKLQDRLLERENSFKITLPNKTEIDALIRLEQLSSEIVECEKKKLEANKHLGRVKPEFVPPTYTKQQLKESVLRERQIKQFKEAVCRIERPEIKTDSRLTGTR